MLKLVLCDDFFFEFPKARTIALRAIHKAIARIEN